ncbi:MAG: putative ArsR family transcriptional regulator [Cellvibrionaceae bacterium]|jgi:predicted ArsR family transcriptional regulator
MKTRTSTRDIILHKIKELHTSTVDSLAEAVDVSPVTVRHHLNALLAAGSIETATVRRSVGRPHMTYSLSKAGEELFPKNYFRLSTLLLEEIRDRFSTDVVKSIFNGVANRIARDNSSRFEGLPFEDRLDFLVTLLEEEGFMARWKKNGNEYQLTEFGCPWLSIGEAHSEVCSFDKELIHSVLKTRFQQSSCMLNGDSCCQFNITAPV